MKSLDFWIPTNKAGFIEWLSEHYRFDKEGKKIAWSKMKVNQLRAIYIQYRKKEEANGIKIKKETAPVPKSGATQMCFEFFKLPGERANAYLR